MHFTPRTLVLVSATVLTTGMTGFLVQAWMDGQRTQFEVRQPAQQARQPTNQVLVTSRDVPAGTLLKQPHLRWQPWPADGLNPTYAVKGKRRMADFVGAVVRKGMVSGEPVSDSRVVRTGNRGFLAAVLTPGMRAVSVPINKTSGVAGLVFPGDHVDLILAHTFYLSNGGAPSRRRSSASETVLTNVRVLAIGQSTDDHKGKPIVAKTATLEVTPKQAEIVALSVRLGKLSLSLRSLGLTNSTTAGSQVPSFTRDSDVSQLIGGDTGSGPMRTVRLRYGSRTKILKFKVSAR